MKTAVDSEAAPGGDDTSKVPPGFHSTVTKHLVSLDFLEMNRHVSPGEGVGGET